MTIVQALAHARRGANRIRMSTVPSREIAEAYEETVAIEHLCKLVEMNLLKPAPSEDIARAILAEMVPRLDDRMAEAVRGAKS